MKNNYKKVDFNFSGDLYQGFLELGNYEQNNRLAILLVDEEGDYIADLSINVEDNEYLNNDEITIQAFGEEDILNFLNKLDLITSYVGFSMSGFEVYNQIKLNIDRLVEIIKDMPGYEDNIKALKIAGILE